MHEYDSIIELGVNFLVWFLVGVIACYGFFTLMEFIDGRPNKD